MAVIRGDVKTLGERRDRALQLWTGAGISQDRVFAALGVSGIQDITLDHLVDMEGMRAAMKNGEATLDESIALYERGAALRQRIAEQVKSGALTL